MILIFTVIRLLTSFSLRTMNCPSIWLLVIAISIDFSWLYSNVEIALSIWKSLLNLADSFTWNTEPLSPATKKLRDSEPINKFFVSILLLPLFPFCDCDLYSKRSRAVSSPSTAALAKICRSLSSKLTVFYINLDIWKNHVISKTFLSVEVY